MSWIAILMNFVGPTVLAFMNPERCQAVIKAISKTIEYVSAMGNENPADDYPAALEFARAQYDLLDAVAGLDSGVDASIKGTVIPFILGFIYHDGSQV